MTPATASDLMTIKRSVTFFLKRGLKNKDALDAMLQLVEGLCEVIRKQEGLGRGGPVQCINRTIIRQEDEHEDSTAGI